MAADLREVCRELDQGVVIQSQDIYRKVKKLVVFDVESTLVQEQSLRVFLEGIREKMGEIPGGIHFVDGEEDQFQALVENARSMKGIPIQEIESFTNVLQDRAALVGLQFFHQRHPGRGRGGLCLFQQPQD